MGGSPLSALTSFVQRPQLLIASVPTDPNWLYVACLLAPVAAPLRPNAQPRYPLLVGQLNGKDVDHVVVGLQSGASPP